MVIEWPYIVCVCVYVELDITEVFKKCFSKTTKNYYRSGGLLLYNIVQYTAKKLIV